METVGAFEAKTHLPQLLERVSKGEKIVITKHGVPVAVLAPVEQNKNVAWALQEAKKFKAERRARGIKPVTTGEILEMVREGRRY